MIPVLAEAVKNIRLVAELTDKKIGGFSTDFFIL